MRFDGSILTVVDSSVAEARRAWWCGGKQDLEGARIAMVVQQDERKRERLESSSWGAKNIYYSKSDTKYVFFWLLMRIGRLTPFRAKNEIRPFRQTEFAARRTKKLLADDTI